MRFDDSEASCVMCSIGLDFAALCDCDDDPCCVRCHRIYHVENWNTRHERQTA